MKRFLAFLMVLMLCLTGATSAFGQTAGRSWKGPMRITRMGTLYAIRTAFDSRYDLLQYMNAGRTNGGAAGPLNFGSTAPYLFDPTTADAKVVGAKAIISPCYDTSDDAAPVQFNGNSYLGGNHGCSQCLALSAKAHGKTAEDVGSEWTDGASQKWYIVQIIDGDTLLMMSQNMGSGDIWSFATAINGNSLTHSQGATHTGTISITASRTSSLVPGISNWKFTVLLDGRYAPTDNGTYACTSVDFVESYTQ